MTNNSISSYVYQFNNGEYLSWHLSWHKLNGYYQFGTTHLVTNAEMFEDKEDIPEWFDYLDGKIVQISLEVATND